MPYHILDLGFSPEKGAIDTSPLAELTGRETVVEAREHLYFRAGEPHLLVALVTRERGETRAEPAPSHWHHGRRCDDARARLDVRDEPLFDVLRSWRKDRAQQDAVPPYVILTNRQLVAIATGRPSSRSALRRIPGIGASRAERLGDEILAHVHGTPRADACDGPRPEEAE